MTEAKLRRVMLDCAARLRDADEGDGPETGERMIDWQAIENVAADLEFAARNEPSGDSGELPAEHGECCEAQARITEARVVREIAAYLEAGSWLGAAAIVRCGDWKGTK